MHQRLLPLLQGAGSASAAMAGPPAPRHPHYRRRRHAPIRSSPPRDAAGFTDLLDNGATLAALGVQHGDMVSWRCAGAAAALLR